MSFKGMDVDAAPGVVDAIREAGKQINTEYDTANGAVTGLNWVGEDADKYKSDWAGAVKGFFDDVVQILNAKADELDQDVQEQQQGSAS